MNSDYLEWFKLWSFSFLALAEDNTEHYQGNQITREEMWGLQLHAPADSGVWLTGRAVPAAALCCAGGRNPELYQGDQRLTMS